MSNTVKGLLIASLVFIIGIMTVGDTTAEREGTGQILRLVCPLIVVYYVCIKR